MSANSSINVAQPPKDDHIKVVVRSRPLNAEEKAANTPILVTCDQERSQVTVAMHGAPTKRNNKKYNYDMVFGQYSTQAEVYKAAIKPVVDEVLLGFNCTVFAYGQTGTGKTHTMEGNVDDPELMGMIPRAVTTIFESLEALDGAEYSVKVSFLELYNEELQDLLSVTDDVKLRIVDDKTRINAGVSCQNLEEIMVKTPEDILNFMKKAMAKRQVGETKLNKASSRSHCIFTMTVHMRETTPEGEDLLKIGKLNLVDLAGSECIGRSGAKNQRAREAGNINKSLLTLGRVISALVEKTPHIPYRDSKLTRLLQESLGGRAKTCIIATVAPSVQCLDETISTLEYASRAKSIKNRPEANQRMTRRAMIKEYAEDLERLRQELAMARAKDGVFLDEIRYNEMVSSLESQKLQIEELEDMLDVRQKELSELQDLFEDTKEELEETKRSLEETQQLLERTKAELEQTKAELEQVKTMLEEMKVLMSAHQHAEGKLHEQALALQSTLLEAKGDVSLLHEKVKRKEEVECHNNQATLSFQQDSLSQIESLSDFSADFIKSQIEKHESLNESLRQMMKQHHSQSEQILQAVSMTSKNSANSLKVLFNEKVPAMKEAAQSHLTLTKNTSIAHALEVDQGLQKAKAHVETPLRQIVEVILANQRQTMETHLSSIQISLTESKKTVTDFAAQHKTMMEQLSKRVSKDAEESRRALETQSVNVESFVKAETERVDNAAAALIEQFSGMLLSFKSQTQANLANMLGETKQNCAESVESILRSEMQTKKQVQDSINVANDWCQTQTAAIDTLSVQVSKGVNDLRKGVDSAEKLSTEALSLLSESVSGLQRKVEGSKQELLQNVDSTCSELDANSAAIRENGENFVTEVHDGEKHLTGLVSALEASNAKDSQSCQTSVDEQKDRVSSFESEIQTRSTKMQDRCNKFVSKDLTRDSPTGTTPRRKKYAFESRLATTHVHEDVLKKYRNSKENQEPDSGPFVFDVSSVVTLKDFPMRPKQMTALEEEKYSPEEDVLKEDTQENFNNKKIPLNGQHSRLELSEISNKMPETEEEDLASKKTSLASSESVDTLSSAGENFEIGALTKDSIMNMKVTQLRKELASRTLSQLGNKSALQTRLLDCLDL